MNNLLPEGEDSSPFLGSLSTPNSLPPAPYVRPLDKKMGQALARRSYYRKADQENWENIANRVAIGNTSLVSSGWADAVPMRNAIAAGSLAMSGRHLQHGDDTQSKKNMELYTNCSTAATSFLLFLLLLNGSGVGRDYSEPMLVTDWDLAPQVLNVCRADHPDFDPAVFCPLHELGQYLKDSTMPVGRTFEVPDSREGWAKAAEHYEIMTFEGTYKDTLLVLDWSVVREKGALIGGMQDRPSSGPVSSAQAFAKIEHNVVGQGYPRWKQTMMVDHFLAECVLVGGARRSARMATMYWKDPNAIAFCTFKQDNRDENGYPAFFSSNNSLICTKEFYADRSVEGSWAKEVFEAATFTAYHHKTGEPGFINVDNFAPEEIDLSLYADGRFADYDRYHVEDSTVPLMQSLVVALDKMAYKFIVNPCAEIKLFLLGGFCVIADIPMSNAETLEDVVRAFRLGTRALIRVNTGMSSIYDREVKRTNRIGVGPTGVFSFAIKFFGISFWDMLDEFGAGREFWQFMSRCSRAVKDEARAYSLKLGVSVPVTDTTIKPAGSTSKLWALEEGAHLPAFVFLLRWVQFRSDDPKLDYYEATGYPVRRDLQSYSGTSIVGFPTQMAIASMGRTDLVVTASKPTTEQHYKYLQLLEKYYIRGVAEDGVTPLVDTGNQVSFTLKADPNTLDYEGYKKVIGEYQSTVRCCSFMFQEDTSAYEYQPEEAISQGRFLHIVQNLTDPEAREDFDLKALQCASGACPI